jgi:hypothetical protein
VRHRFVVDGLWNLPKYHQGKGLIGQVLSGWQANGIYTWHTGAPEATIENSLFGLSPAADAGRAGIFRALTVLNSYKDTCEQAEKKGSANALPIGN